MLNENIDNIPKITICFLRMRTKKCVRITKEFRKRWGTESLGAWFQVLAINCDDTVTLQGAGHQIFTNVPIKEIIV